MALTFSPHFWFGTCKNKDCSWSPWKGPYQALPHYLDGDQTSGAWALGTHFKRKTSFDICSHTNQRRQWYPTPVLLPGKFHGRRSLVGCSPWGRKESDRTARLHFHFSLSCIGEGNGNPLHCSCLENPREGGAWWAALYGVAQSRTRLKRLSSSSSSSSWYKCWRPTDQIDQGERQLTTM